MKIATKPTVQVGPDEIDTSIFTTFKEISQQIAQLDKSKWSEADTRLKFIDRILFEVLGWNKNEAKVEDNAGSKYVDYTLRSKNSARVVVEAKREAATFNFKNRQSGQAYKLNGTVYNAAAKEAINQAIEYSAFKNNELACITNGNEWSNI